MYSYGDDEQFRKTLPAWVRFLLLASLFGFLPYATGVFSPNVVPPGFKIFLLAFGLIGFGISGAALILHGVSMGYLPARFHVSRRENPFQFWLTVMVMLCFALGITVFGGAVLVAFISNQ